MAILALGEIGCRSGVGTSPQGESESKHDELADRAVRMLTGAIRIPTVNPPGDERPLARYFVGELRRAGLEAALVPTPPRGSPRGRAAAWGRLAGSGKRPPLVLLSHLDVVPADPGAWQVDPFAGVRQGGFVVGRGALDAKGVSVVHLLALAELHRHGRVPDRDLIFLATPDEETGGRDGAGFVARERPDLLRGARYVLTEGGSISRGSAGRPAAWGVAVTEKSPCWLRVVSRGTTGHSAVPLRDAAVPRLIAGLERLRRFETAVRVVPEVRRMYAALAPVSSERDRAGFADLPHHLDHDPAFRERFLGTPAHEAMVRDTLAITVLEGSPGTNVVAGVASAHVDARLLPGGQCSAFAVQLRRALGDPGLAATPLLSFTSRSSPVDTPLFRAIARVAERTDPGAAVVPRVTAGFTDAHYFREIGLMAYGFTPRWFHPDELRGIHGANERISIGNLVRGVETLVEILIELDKVD